MFIVIEAIDGAGKGFQRERLVDYLTSVKLVDEVKTTDFPDHEGILYRDIIHPAISGDIKISKSALFVSFALDQLLWQDKIASFKNSKTKHFIVDGYFTTNIVYQSLMLGNFKLQEVLDFAKIVDMIEPDVNVFLDVNPVVAMKRKEMEDGHEEGLDIYESSLKKQYKISDGFKKMVKENIFGDWLMIDGNGSKQEVTNGLIEALKDNKYIN